MASLTSLFHTLPLFLALSSSTFVAAKTNSEESKKSLESRFITPSSFGTHGGYFYNWWSDGTSPTAEYTNLPLGGYEWLSQPIFTDDLYL